jgi:hypothetical protein
MKQNVFTFCAILIACFGFVSLKAQINEDVTSLYLTNTGFETAPITFTVSDGEANGTTAKTTDGTAYVIPGWTGVYAGWSRAATAKYGITFATFPDVLNGVNPPATNPNGGEDGAGLKISAAWGGTATLTQETTSALPLGDYTLEFQINNRTSLTMGGSRFGFIAADGTETYGTETSFPEDIWTTERIDFQVTAEAVGKISLGFISAGSGSADNPKLYVDDVKLIYRGVDRTEFYDLLNAKIAEATTAYGTGDGLGAADLQAAITAAQAIADDSEAALILVTEATATLDAVLLVYRIANASEEAPVDMTRFIQNPYFDKGNTGWSWNTGATNTGTFVAETKPELTPGSETYNEKYANGHGDFVGNVWENWKSSAFTGKMYQEVSGLENGKYSLSATVFANLTWIDAKTVDGELTEPEIDWLFLYANEDKTPVTDPQLIYTYSVTGYVNDGTMELGLNISEAVANWFAIDNFKLEFLGYDLDVAAAYLQQRIDYASAIENEMNSGVWDELQAAITAGNTAVATPEKETLNAVVIRLNEAITAAETSIAAYETLLIAIDVANVNKVDYTNFAGYNTFVAAIASAQGKYDARQLDAEGIDAAIVALKAAEIACRLTQATPFDATFVLQNPSFEEGTYIGEGNGYDTPTGWILDFNYASGKDSKAHDANPYDGAYIYNIWSNGLNEIDLYQELTLPPGLYELSAVIRTEDFAVNGTQAVYALIDEMTPYESLFYAYPYEDAFPEDWETSFSWVRLVAEFYVPEGSSVRVGAHSTGDGTTAYGWFQIDDFRLTLVERDDVGIKTPQTPGSSLELQGVKGGVNITATAETKVNIYAVTGQLVKAATINGKSFVALLPGVYIVNHQKIIVK